MYKIRSNVSWTPLHKCKHASSHAQQSNGLFQLHLQEGTMRRWAHYSERPHGRSAGWRRWARWRRWACRGRACSRRARSSCPGTRTPGRTPSCPAGTAASPGARGCRTVSQQDQEVQRPTGGTFVPQLFQRDKRKHSCLACRFLVLQNGDHHGRGSLTCTCAADATSFAYCITSSSSGVLTCIHGHWPQQALHRCLKYAQTSFASALHGEGSKSPTALLSARML